MVEWKPIPGFDYEASSIGQIRKANGGRISASHISKRNGYQYVGLQYMGKWKVFRLARLVAKAFYGESDLQVDHINGIRSDDRIENLRYATARQNNQYRASKTNPFIGAYLCSSRKKWQSTVFVNGRNKFIGSYNTKEEAHAAYIDFVKNVLKQEPVQSGATQ